MTWSERYSSYSTEYGYYNPSYQRINDLKKLMTTGYYAKKYKKGDTLDNADIEDIAKSILKVFEDAYPQRKAPILGNGYNKLTKDKQEDLVLEYIRKVLDGVTFGDETYNKFVSLLTLNTGKGVPYSFEKGVYFSKPSILDNAMFYMTHQDMPIQLETTIKTDNQIYNEMTEELKEQVEAKKKLIEELEQNANLTKQQKEKEIEKLNEEIAQYEEKIANERKNFKIAKDNVESAAKKIDDIHTLLTGDERKILDDIARHYGYDRSFKQHIGDVRKALKANTKLNLDDNQINYIITKASEDYNHMRKMMESNQDLFDRDMSQDTIQKENEQFQSKLRQQNLRYILPKFIERREKLVENTLNPNLLKGAFAV